MLEAIDRSMSKKGGIVYFKPSYSKQASAERKIAFG